MDWILFLWGQSFIFIQLSSTTFCGVPCTTFPCIRSDSGPTFLFSFFTHHSSKDSFFSHSSSSNFYILIMLSSHTNRTSMEVNKYTIRSPFSNFASVSFLSGVPLQFFFPLITQGRVFDWFFMYSWNCHAKQSKSDRKS